MCDEVSQILLCLPDHIIWISLNVLPIYINDEWQGTILCIQCFFHKYETFFHAKLFVSSHHYGPLLVSFK